MGKIIQNETLIDKTSGEILHSTTNVFELKKLPDEPPYIKMYVDDLGAMLGLQQGHRDILLYVAASVGYDGVVGLTAGRKARIALTLGISEKSIKNAITEFVKRGILVRIARSEYELNPALFARGDWASIHERRKKFSATIVYGPKGRTITTTVLEPESTTGEYKQVDWTGDFGEQK